MPDIESLLEEKRRFKPDPAFARQANWTPKIIREHRKLAAQSPTRFWAKMAREHVSWFKPWKQVLQWKPPFAKWFLGGRLNVSFNCLDRHLEGENAWRRNKAAIIWEGEPGDQRVLTFGQLHREVCKFANVLKAHGVKKGDRVALYMPMIPELAIAVLACTPLVIRMRVEEASEEGARQGGVIRDLLRERCMWGMLVAAAGYYGAFGIYEAIWAVFLDDLGASQVFIGVTLTIFAVPIILMAPAAGRVAARRGPMRVALLAILVTIPSVALYGVFENLWLLTLLMVVQAVGDAGLCRVDWRRSDLPILPWRSALPLW